jgi:hypothetical protein
MEAKNASGTLQLPLVDNPISATVIYHHHNTEKEKSSSPLRERAKGFHVVRFNELKSSPSSVWIRPSTLANNRRLCATGISIGSTRANPFLGKPIASPQPDPLPQYSASPEPALALHPKHLLILFDCCGTPRRSISANGTAQDWSA